MRKIHDFHDNNSLDRLTPTAHIISQVVHRSDRTQQKIDNGSTSAVKEITMHANGHTTVWGTHIGVGRATDGQGWYQQLRAWWTTHKAARHDAKLATLRARWDARREAVRPRRADTAIDMVASTHAFSTTTTLCDLGV
jgi:hypothetical protein